MPRPPLRRRKVPTLGSRGVPTLRAGRVWGPGQLSVSQGRNTPAISPAERLRRANRPGQWNDRSRRPTTKGRAVEPSPSAAKQRAQKVRRRWIGGSIVAGILSLIGLGYHLTRTPVEPRADVPVLTKPAGESGPRALTGLSSPRTRTEAVKVEPERKSERPRTREEIEAESTRLRDERVKVLRAHDEKARTEIDAWAAESLGLVSGFKKAWVWRKPGVNEEGPESPPIDSIQPNQLFKFRDRKGETFYAVTTRVGSSEGDIWLKDSSNREWSLSSLLRVGEPEFVFPPK